MKKIVNSVFSIALAGLMVVPAMAAATTADITINGADDSDVYDAYQLLTLETSLKSTDTCAEGTAHTSGCYNYIYSVNSKYQSILQAVTGETDDADILNYISEQTAAEDIQAFADSVYTAIKSAGLTADKTGNGSSIEGVDQGYYLIAERTTASNTAKSLVILNTAGYDEVTVDSKAGSVPTVDKDVLEINDSDSSVEDSYGDTADYDAGDTVTFKLTGTMPDNIDDYARYKYVFHDTLPSTLSYDTDSVEVIIDGKTIPSTMYVVDPNGTALTITFSNIKNILDEGGSKVVLTADSKVVVTYTATLADASTVQVKQDNAVKLEYSNDPYYTGHGSGYDEPETPPDPGPGDTPDDGDDTPEEPTSETPETEVSVFTYYLVVSKVDQAGKALTGATFTLYKWDKTASDWKEVSVIASENAGNDGATFTFNGLDAGKYKLVETGVPTGYNKGDDIEFQISAETTTDGITSLSVTDGDGNATTLLTVETDTSDKPTGKVDTTIENVGGSILPSTGGAGTYMLYGLGCALLVGGAALAVTKKRKQA